MEELLELKDLLLAGNLADALLLVDEMTRPLAKVFTNLSTSLTPGLNMGYVSFQNFRGTQDGFTDTYTIRLNNLNLTCSDQTSYEQPLAIRFDESEIGFVDLIAKGMSKKDIRNKWVAEPYKDVGLKAHDVANLLVFMIKIL